MALPPTIRIVVPATAGGTVDTQARLLARELSPILGVTIVVDNKPGAAGLIGGAEVARSVADGSTLLYTADYVVTQSPHGLKKMAFDPFMDLKPIARAADTVPVLVASKQAPFQTLAELITYARANPGKVSFASWGTGTGSHLYGEILGRRHDLELIHVPYRGVVEAMMDLLANRIGFTFQPPAVLTQYVGKINALATAGTVRNPMFADIPTFRELGLPGFEMGGWVGFFGPGRMAEPLVEQLNMAINAALSRPAVATMWKEQGCVVVREPAARIGAKLRSDASTWGRYFKEVGLHPQ